MATFQILTLDGGGIRGAFGTALIAKIEQKLGAPITEYFDLVAGTSTGAILGAGLAHGLSGEQLRRFYQNHGGRIFTPREPYVPVSWVRPFYPLIKYVFRRRTDGGKLDDFFRARFCPHALRASFIEAFGDATLSDLTRSRLIVPAVNLSRGQTQVFRTPHLPDSVDDASTQVVDVLLATTAAPTYFPHKVMPNGEAFCDGGLWANNPAILGIAEAFKIRQYCTRPQCDPVYDTASIRVLSIGTGETSYSLSPPGIDAGALYWAPHIADVMGTSQVQGVQTPLDYLLGDRYQQVNFEIPDASWTLDNVDRIPDLLKLGERAGELEFERLADTFFTTPKTEPYTPFVA